MATADESEDYLDEIDTAVTVENQEEVDDDSETMLQEPIIREVEVFENQRLAVWFNIIIT